MKNVSFNSLTFNNWKNLVHEGNKISHWWGKTFFYYDKNNDKLYYETFSPFTRLLHRLFGYKKQFNRENLWLFLKNKKIVQGDIPKKGSFRKAVEKTWKEFSTNKDTFFKLLEEKTPNETPLIEILKNIPDLDSLKNKNADSVLFQAAQHGKLEVVTYLIDQRNQEINEVFASPLNIALENQQYEVALLLIKRGAKLNYFEPTLHLAIQGLAKLTANKRSTAMEVIKTIIQQDPQAVHTCNRGCTALYKAYYLGDKEVIQLLLEKGADIHECGKYGEPPIFATIRAEDKIEFTRDLISRGAQINYQTHEKETPLIRAIKGDFICKGKKSNPEMLKLLIDNGADVNKLGGLGVETTPLILAVLCEDLEAVKLLIAHGAQINVRAPFSDISHETKTALDVALIMLKNKENVALTLENKEDAAALTLENKEIVQYLTKMGTLTEENLDRQELLGKTP